MWRTPLVEIFFFPMVPEILGVMKKKNFCECHFVSPAKAPEILDVVKGVGKHHEEGGDVDSNKYSPQLWNQGLIDQKETKNGTKVEIETCTT